jgi:methylglutaconyl-CoA hydratase
MSPPVQYEVLGARAQLTVDRPEVRNALDWSTLVALAEGLERAAADPQVRTVVLGATGSVFCAGADLTSAAQSGDESFASSAPAALARVLELMITLPKPVIARIQGPVVGGGVGLVAASDLAVAVESATFAFGEVRLGVAPAVVSVAVLRKMQPAAAAELMLTGARVSALRVLEAGLVNRVVSDNDLDATVQQWVAEVDRSGPRAVAATKALLEAVPTMSRAAGWEWTAQLSGQLFGSDEAAEGMAAFLGRRSADWSRFVGGDLFVERPDGP